MLRCSNKSVCIRYTAFFGFQKKSFRCSNKMLISGATFVWPRKEIIQKHCWFSWRSCLRSSRWDPTSLPDLLRFSVTAMEAVTLMMCCIHWKMHWRDGCLSKEIQWQLTKTPLSSKSTERQPNTYCVDWSIALPMFGRNFLWHQQSPPILFDQQVRDGIEWNFCQKSSICNWFPRHTALISGIAQRQVNLSMTFTWTTLSCGFPTLQMREQRPNEISKPNVVVCF